MKRITLLVSLVISISLFVLPPAVNAQGGEGPSTVDSAPPTRLVIPSIDLDAAITPAGWISSGKNSYWEVPHNAVGWHDDSAIPGYQGNVVLSGHQNIDGKVFRNLKDVSVGDSLTVYAGDQAFEYQVTQRLILLEAFQPLETRLSNARWIGPFPDKRVTLVTCHPSWTNTHRLIVIAKPTPRTGTAIIDTRLPPN